MRSIQAVMVVMVSVMSLGGGVPARAQAPGESFKDCDLCPEMVGIAKGSFTMGDQAGIGLNWEKPPHAVNLSKDFALGKFEVTQAQWQAVMGANPSAYKGDDHPVEMVSWDEVQVYLEKLSAMTGKTYRLPTEAEWEYAARAGTDTPYAWGDTATRDHANYGKDEKFGGKHTEGADRWADTAPVGQFQPNPFGLYDMQGNLSEWVADCWHQNYEGAPTDGSAWDEGDCGIKMFRGGAFASAPKFIRSASRGKISRRYQGNFIGFRVARDLP